MHKVIYDTDPGVDDAMALLFLHRHPDIDLLGVDHGVRQCFRRHRPRAMRCF